MEEFNDSVVSGRFRLFPELLCVKTEADPEELNLKKKVNRSAFIAKESNNREGNDDHKLLETNTEADGRNSQTPPIAATCVPH